EIEQFLDTPVKYYSSGMYMRLAFSVAAHLEPEMLLVDEVLAVGDGSFQKKCLGKMGCVAKEGRTVLFVTHNIPAIRSLCERCIILERGHLAFSGQAEDCIERYLAQNSTGCNAPSVVFQKPAKRRLWMHSATLICNGRISTILSMGDSLALAVDFISELPVRHPRLGFVLKS